MIFGVGSPRFVYKHGLEGEEIVDLDYAVITEHTPETEYVEHLSEIDLDREFIWRRDNRRVRLLINLFKYADPAAKYVEIVSHKGHFVSLFLHRDGFQFASQVVDDVITDALFCLKEITPFFIETAEYRDGLILEFENANPVSIGIAGKTIWPANIIWVPLYDADGLPVYDEEGKQVMVRQ